MGYRKGKNPDKIRGEKDMYCIDDHTGRKIKQSDARFDPDGHVVHKSNLDEPSSHHYLSPPPRKHVIPEPMRTEDVDDFQGFKEVLYPRRVIVRAAVSLTTAITRLLTLTHSAIATSTLIKQINKAISLTATGTASLTKAIATTYNYTATATSTLTKSVSTAFSVTATATASLVTSLIYMYSASATATGTSILTKQAQMNYNFTATGTASLSTLYTPVSTGLGLDQFEILNNNFTDRWPARQNYATLQILR